MSKWLAILIGFGAPFAIWALVFAMVRMRRFDLNSASRVISGWRWIALLAALAFLFGYFTASPPWSISWSHYFWCAIWFSLNLFFPQQWLRRQMRRSQQVGT
jgi:hypothetical protein